MTTPTPFRSHDLLPTPRDGAPRTLFTALLEEWVDLNRSRVTARTVQQWASRHPELQGAHRPADIVDTVDNAPADQQDAILLTLLRLTQAGEQLAGRILLQQMLPRLARLRRHIKGPDDLTTDRWTADESAQIFVATFWELIVTYPIGRRPSRVAANLALDILGHVHRILRHSSTEVVLPGRPLDNWVVDIIGPLYPPREPHPDSNDDDQLPSLLLWATDTGVLTPSAAQVMNSVYVKGETPLEYSRRTGLTHAAVKQTCTRSKRRLREALAQTNTPAYKVA